MGHVGEKKKRAGRFLRRELCQKIWLAPGGPVENCFIFDVIDSLPVGIFTLNRDRRIAYVSQNFARLAGSSQEELEEKPWEELMASLSNGKGLPFTLEEVLSGQRVVNFRTSIKNKNGSEKPVLLSLYPVRNGEGAVAGVVGLVKDLTDHVTLEEWHQQVDFLLDTINQGVIVVDNEGRITALNRSGEEMMGLKAEEIVGREYDKVITPLFHNPQRFLMETLKTGQEFHLRNQEVIYRGKKYYIDIDTYQLRDDCGRVLGAVKIFRDNTRERLLEESMAQAEKLALVGKIAAGLAHEIRNPLTAVRGFLQLMAEKHAGDEKEGSYYRIMLSEIDRINEIVNDLLLISRPGRPEEEEVDLVQVLKEVILFIDAQALLSRVDVLTDIRAEKAVIAGGYSQLKNILLNIIQNAFDAMPEGGLLEVTLAIVEEEKNDGNKTKVARVEIRDSGIGIPREHQPHIFDPFYSTKETGTGLGLTVTYRLVQEIGGKIEFTSKEGFGTKFILTFPVIRDEEEEKRKWRG